MMALWDICAEGYPITLTRNPSYPGDADTNLREFMLLNDEIAMHPDVE